MNIGESTLKKLFFFMFFFYCSYVESGSAVTYCAPTVKGLSPLSTLRGERHITHFLLSNRSGFSLELQAFRASQQELLVPRYVRNL